MKLSTSGSVAAAALMVVALLLTGCGDGAAADTSKGAPSASGSSSTSRAPSPTDSEPPAPAPAEELLVTMTVSGGIDGRHESMLVNGDGSYTVLSRGKPERKGQMKPTELIALRTALAEADFAELPRINLAEQPIFDGLTTAVVYRGHEVVTDGSKPVPGLDRVIAALPPTRAGS